MGNNRVYDGMLHEMLHSRRMCEVSADLTIRMVKRKKITMFAKLRPNTQSRLALSCVGVKACRLCRPVAGFLAM